MNPMRRVTDMKCRRFRMVRMRVEHIIMRGDITFAILMLGVCCIMWGVIGLMYKPDLEWYARGFALEIAPWLWGFNHIAFGVALIHCAVWNFPPGRSLMIGTYGVFCFTWVAMGRPASSMSSGVTLNFILIFMSALLIQRSGKR